MSARLVVAVVVALLGAVVGAAAAQPGAGSAVVVPIDGLSPLGPPPAQPAPPAPAQPAPPAPAPAAAPPLAGVTDVQVVAPANDDGRHLEVSFTRAADVAAEVATVIVRRRHGTPGAPPRYPPLVADGAWAPSFAGPTPPPLAALAAGVTIGPWTVAAVLVGGETSFTDQVAPGHDYEYVVAEVLLDHGVPVAASAAEAIGPRRPEAALVHTGRLGYLAIVALIAGLIAWYVRRARTAKDLYVRSLPGVEAIEDAVGRSTEMGRPVLYVTGLEDIQNIQTIASLLVLGHVAEKTATYDTDLTVANYYPLTMVVAEEVVRQGYANAGRPDAHRPERCLFITAEQFAFAAGVSGIILRDRPATNIYLGCFYGESLLLAETGFVTGAVQIAGTAELTQLPFFITACDYTLIGEELYAASAYLTKEPTLLANLKAADAFKIVAMVFIVVSVIAATGGWFDLGGKVFP